MDELDKFASGGIFGDGYAESEKKQPHSSESSSKEIEVMPLPKDNMPPDFNGAVGDFNFDVKISPEGTVMLGDAVTITMEISGRGNFSMLKAPVIKEDGSFVLYEPSIVKEGPTYKVFEQVLIPRDKTFEQVPSVSFSYFSPKDARYMTLRNPAVKMAISDIPTRDEEEKPKVIEKNIEPKIRPKEEIGKDIIYIKESPGHFSRKGSYLYNNGAFLAFNLFPVFLYLLTFFSYRHHQRLVNDKEYARRRQAYKKARKAMNAARALYNDDEQKFYYTLFTMVQEYLADKFNLPPGGVTDSVVDDVLKPRKVDTHMLKNIEEFFEGCYVARFTPRKQSQDDKKRLFMLASKILEYFKNA
jgi:hypothetical protein